MTVSAECRPGRRGGDGGAGAGRVPTAAASGAEQQQHQQPADGAARGPRGVLYTAITYAVLAHLLYGLLRPQAPPAAGGGSGDGVSADAAVDHFTRMAALVVPHGYPLEEHFVTTADGFILRVFRIPSGRASSSDGGSSSDGDSSSGRGSRSDGNSSCDGGGSPSAAPPANCSRHNDLAGAGVGAARAPRPVALLQHALMDSSAGWVLLGPGRGLAFQLADAGFDVWLMNSRGNCYSRNHTRLDPDADAAFWRWSWADMADHDLPAAAEHVAAATGQPSMVFFGYSQGTMIGLAALATQPALAARFSLAVLLVPVAFTRHTTSLPFALLARARLDQHLLAAGMLGEWGRHYPAHADRVSRACLWAPRVCALYLTAVCGANPRGNLEPALVSALMRHLPVGTSVQNMAHWSQGIRSRSASGLLRYDHGSDCSAGRACNLAAYGQAVPPAYNLTAITTPIALFTGDRDALAPPADVELLKASLAPGVLAHHRAEPDYAHLDYEIGADASDRVYSEIVGLALRAARAA